MIMSAISFTYGPCFLLLKNVKIFQEVPSKEKKFPKEMVAVFWD